MMGLLTLQGSVDAPRVGCGSERGLRDSERVQVVPPWARKGPWVLTFLSEPSMIPSGARGELQLRCSETLPISQMTGVEGERMVAPSRAEPRLLSPAD